MIKLFILRNLFWALSALYGLGNPAGKWLAHYLGGKGTEKKLDQPDVLAELLPLLVRLSFVKEFNSYHGGEYARRINEHTKLVHFDNNPEAFACFGFVEKPTFFKMIGGFTANLSFSRDGVVIVAKDRYDWHPTCPVRGSWHGTPTGLPPWLTKLAAKLFGSEYFWVEDGASYISNQLWFDCQKAGAKEFTTTLRVELTYSELRKFKRQAQIIEKRWRYSR